MVGSACSECFSDKRGGGGVGMVVPVSFGVGVLKREVVVESCC